jgi:sugar O-acyltransferase (sialic acid O-acetyltransferase NeuD family)
LIIVGDTAFAEIAYEYFTYDSPYEVVAFSVEKKFLKKHELFGLPVIPFEELEAYYEPQTHAIFVASVYTELNRLRTRLYLEAKARGYSPASYISSKAFVWRNCQIGEHCFIFENNVVQPFVRMGDNVVLWSGNHIGHHSEIKNHCFISSHVVISGYVTIEDNCFLGVNATIANNLTVGRDCLIGAGAVILKDVPADRVVKGNALEPMGSAKRIFKVKECVSCGESKD